MYVEEYKSTGLCMYPYPRPETSYLLTEENDVFFLEVPGSSLNDLFNTQVEDMGNINNVLRDIDVPLMEERIPVVAYGSNANPEIMRRKLSKRKGVSKTVPVYKGKTNDFDIVYGSYISKAGSIPAQIVPSPGTEPEVWINFLDSKQIELIHNSEGLSKGHYFLGVMDFKLENGAKLKSVYGYFPKKTGTFIDKETGKLIRLASRNYRGTDHKGRILIPGKHFVPVQIENSDKKQRTQLEMMETYIELSRELFGEDVFVPSGNFGYDVSQWARGNQEENRLMFNKKLRENHGQLIFSDVEAVEEPYNTGGLKKLRKLV